jgi:hypothetical protein
VDELYMPSRTHNQYPSTNPDPAMGSVKKFFVCR